MIEERPYRLSRNPLYVGLTALYLGPALLAPTFWWLVLFPAVVLLVLWGAIYPDERFLHKRFGAPYDDNTRRVRRWLSTRPTCNGNCWRHICRWSDAVARTAMVSSALDVVSRNRVSGAFNPDETNLVVTRV